jgi:hypothetical protein
MDDLYRVEAWQALYTAVASVTAALSGLLFLAFSLNMQTILKVPLHRARAREIFGMTLSLLVLSLLMLIPQQDHRVLGGELIAGSLVLVLVAGRFHLRMFRRLAPRLRLSFSLRLASLHLGTLSLVIAGISLAIEQFGGLFWLVPTILVYMLWSLTNAWQLVVQASEE